MMELFGFAAILAIGFCLCYMGVAWAHLSVSFSERTSVYPFLCMIAGIAMIAFALYYAPFTVTFSGTA